MSGRLRPAELTRRHVAITVLFIVGVTSIAIGTTLARTLVSDRAERRAESIRRGHAEAEKVAKTLDEELRSVQPIVQSIAERVSSGALDGAALPGIFEKEIVGNDLLFGIGAAYEPYSYRQDRRLYAPYYVRDQTGTPVLRYVDDEYDYTQFQHRWYGDTLLEGAGWSEPYFGRVADTQLVEYSVPFYSSDTAAEEGAEPAGIIYANFSADHITDLLADLGIGRLGYGLVLSREGGFISHPRKELVSSDRTIFDIAWERGDTALHSMAVRAIQGIRGDVDYQDNLTNQTSKIIFEPIASTGWSLAFVFIDEDEASSANRTRRDILHIILAFLLGGCSLCLLVLALRFDGIVHQWMGIAAVSALLIAAIGGVWMTSTRYPLRPEASRFRIVDQATLKSFESRLEREAGPNQEASLLFVPTGVFVKSIAFTSGNDVDVTGYVWQRYTHGVHDRLEPGFSLPEAESPEITVAYQKVTEEETLIGWYFVAKLRQEFNYDRFPLDEQEVWLRLRHKDLDEHVVLVPDLSSYSHMDPRSRPGVETDLLLPGWRIKSSYFNYREHEYSTNFGMAEFEASIAELHFNVDLQREFLSPFVSRIIPLFVVAAMLFAMVLVSSMVEATTQELLGSAMQTVLGCAALFFVLIFEHISLRETLPSPRILYFEYFYFTAYTALMVVSLNSILLASGTGLWVIEHRDNLVPKMAFWPAFLAILFLATATTFY